MEFERRKEMNLTTSEAQTFNLYYTADAFADYIDRTVQTYHTFTNGSEIKIRKSIPAIKKVIFNYPTTIVFWADKTKTVVKCGENDIFDPEKGLAMAIARKALGNQGNYYNTIKKWLPPEMCAEASFRAYLKKRAMLLGGNKLI